MLSILCKFHSY